MNNINKYDNNDTENKNDYSYDTTTTNNTILS